MHRKRIPGVMEHLPDLLRGGRGILCCSLMKQFWNVVTVISLVAVIVSAVLSWKYFVFFYVTLFAFAVFVIATAMRR